MKPRTAKRELFVELTNQQKDGIRVKLADAMLEHRDLDQQIEDLKSAKKIEDRKIVHCLTELEEGARQQMVQCSWEYNATKKVKGGATQIINCDDSFTFDEDFTGLKTLRRDNTKAVVDELPMIQSDFQLDIEDGAQANDKKRAKVKTGDPVQEPATA